MLRWLLTALLVIVGLAAVVCVGGYFVLKRPDIPFETLASRYGNAESRYVDLPSDIHMHYRDQGDATAPVILLVHGYSASLHSWEAWVPRLAEDYRVISIDLPGHGLTQTPQGYRASIEAFRDAVDEFATSQNIQRFALAGNSMGGNVAWEYALAHPDKLDALILVDAAGWPQPSRAMNQGMLKLLGDPTFGPILRDLDNTALFRRGLEAAFADPALATDAMVTRYTDLARAPGHRDILVQMTLGFSSRHFATRERLAAIRTPTLILVGGQDHLIPPEHAQQFHDAIAGSQLVRYDAIGHMPQEEHAADSVQDVLDFLGPLHQTQAPTAAARR